MNYGKLTAGTTKTAIDTAKPSEKGEIITYLSRMGDVLHDIEERSEVIILWLVTIHAVIDCNKADLLLRKHHLRIETNLQIVSSEAAHVLYDDGSDFSVFYFRKHFLESRTIEISPCIPIISEVLDIYKSIFMGVFFEILLLVQYRV